MLQFRPTGESGPMYAPARDIVYLYPDVIRSVNERLEAEADRDVTQLMKQHGVTLDEMVDVAHCYARFLESAHDSRQHRNIVDALRASGWFLQPAMARLVYMYYVGTCVTGSLFQGIREVTESGSSPPPEARCSSLRSAMRRLLLVSKMSERSRKWYFRWRAVKKAFRRLIRWAVEV